jgi:pimeloyl-ACP methyl ester carboxylesterase
MMENIMNKNGIVIVHGSWHQGSSFSALVKLLENEDYFVDAVTLPGAGDKAKSPASYLKRPLDPSAFSTEVSPNADVTQEQRTETVVKAINDANKKTGGKAIVVAHSLGGLSVTAAVEQIPDAVSGVLYVSAFMFPQGVVAGGFLEHPSMSNSKVGDILLADPATVGVLRIDPRSEDSKYISATHEILAEDVPINSFKAALEELHPDEPAQVLGTPSTATSERFGTVKRYFAKLTNDKVIPPEAQNALISDMDEAMKNKTVVHEIASSHSAPLSNPQALVDLIQQIAK